MRGTLAILALLLLCVTFTAASSSSNINSPAFRALADGDSTGSDLSCYGNYCGLQSVCVNGKKLTPSMRDAPIDKLDAACFLHDVCYTCANPDSANSTGTDSDSACCPDASLLGIDKAECDRVLLVRLRNDSVCEGSPLNDREPEDVVNQLVGRNSTAAELAGCDATRLAAIALIESVLAGRVFNDELTGTGQPSATSNANATCPAFQCPYTANSACFQPCGDDGCGSQCGGVPTNGSSTCPSGQTCNAYAHACFLPNGNLDNDGAAATIQLNPLVLVLGAILAAAPLTAFT